MRLTYLLNGFPKKSIKDVVSDSDITLVDICTFAGDSPGVSKISEANSLNELIGYTPAIASTIDLINWQQENVFNNDSVYLISRSKIELRRFTLKLVEAYEWRYKVREAIKDINGSLVNNADLDNFLNVLYNYRNTIKSLDDFFENKVYSGPELVVDSSVDASKTDCAIVGSALGYSKNEGKKSVVLTRDIDIPKIFIGQLDFYHSEEKEKLLDNVAIYFVDKVGRDCWHFDPRAFNGRAKSFIWSLEKSHTKISTYKK